MKQSELELAIIWLERHGLTISHGYIPGGTREYARKVDHVWTKEEWDAYQWNPPPGKPKADPNASSKPSWEELQEAKKGSKILDYEAEIYAMRKGVAREEARKIKDSEVHVGANDMNSMTNLVHILEDANVCGHSLCAPIIMRDGEGALVEIWTQRQLRLMLNELALKRNQLENKHNSAMSDFEGYVVIQNDENLPVEHRIKAAQTARGILHGYASWMRDEHVTHDLPRDDDVLREVLDERLEAAALQHARYLTGAVTQQGVDLGPTSPSQSKAVQRVSRQCMLGKLTQGNPQLTRAQMLEVHKSQLSSIRVIGVPGTPVWDTPEIGITVVDSSLLAKEWSYRGRRLKVKAGSPEYERPDYRPCRVVEAAGDHATFEHSLTTYDPGSEVVVTIEVTEPTVVDLLARNLNGPSRLRINFT